MRISKLAIILLICCSAKALACVTPVYRFALEEWFCDLYRVTIFYEPDTLLGAQEQLLPLVEATQISYGDWPAELTVKPQKETVKANLSLRFVNVKGPMEPAEAQMWQAQRDSEVPWAVIRYPSSAKMTHVLWSGPLADFKLAAHFIDSPVRQEIHRHLLDGETAVWLLVETADREANQTAMERIRQGIAVSKKELKLPAAVDEKDMNVLSGTTAAEWRVSFQTLTVSRDNPEEVPFITMMLKSQPDLLKYLNEPIAFVLYGRCRTLKGIPASQLTEQAVLESNKFLLDSCQCEVKDQNPGTDMLVKTDWTEFDKRIAELKRKEFPLRGITDYMVEAGDENDKAVPAVEHADGGGSTQPEVAVLKAQNAADGSIFQVKHVVLTLVLTVFLAGAVTIVAVTRKKNESI